MRTQRTRGSSGFTLVELMIVVVILGVLAAVAIPSFTRYVKRSKTSEALTNIAEIYQGEVTYYEHAKEHMASAAFVQTSATPSTSPGQTKYQPNVSLWSNDLNWAAIGFSLDSAHYYQYQAISSVATQFTARARGDLDGDGSLSAFTREGAINSGEVQGTPIVIVNELE